LTRPDLCGSLELVPGVLVSYRAVSLMQRIFGANSAATILIASALIASAADAALVDWQAAVAAGTPAGYTNANVTSPIVADIGVYNESTNGGISYEFIVNATNADGSSALMGRIHFQTNLDSAALKFEQFQSKGTYGVTNYNSRDYDSRIPNAPGVDTHLVFVNNSVDTLLYVNGAFAATISGVSLTLTGQVGIGGAARSIPTSFRDPLHGTIIGVAVYDAALSPAEVAEHARAYGVPEPTALALVTLGGALTAACHRRRA
jgi:hypothetical protein